MLKKNVNMSENKIEINAFIRRSEVNLTNISE